MIKNITHRPHARARVAALNCPLRLPNELGGKQLPNCSEICLELSVLLRELEKHGIVKELVNGDILTEALSPPHLQHELAGKVRGGCRLQGPEQNRPVERISWHQLPMVKHGLAHGLPRCVCSK